MTVELKSLGTWSEDIWACHTKIDDKPIYTNGGNHDISTTADSGILALYPTPILSSVIE